MDEPTEGDDPPLTVHTLADLQAGLLDDDTAAKLRKRVRTDPHAAQLMDALNRVRRDVADLDGSSAPEVDPAVVDGVSAALRADQPGAAHSVRPGRLPRSARIAVAGTGLAAVAVAIWLGTSALLKAPAPTQSEPTTIDHITVSRPPATIPLSDQEILGQLDRVPDFGPLADPQRRASCLAGLGYPADTRLLGARPVDIAGRPAVLLLLPGDTPGAVTALAVAPTCSSIDTGLLADRIVNRP
jgi:anti-sigma factor RsiW